jgi:Flp pilus assembly pilin Flp
MHAGNTTTDNDSDRDSCARNDMHISTGDQRGQATTEYALILLVAAVIAMLAIGWATAGGGAGKIGGLFDALLQGIIDRASSEL